jgi:signal-transduction protein with cAMP-binding, CBS, and nucleotidyltransferase domain
MSNETIALTVLRQQLERLDAQAREVDVQRENLKGSIQLLEGITTKKAPQSQVLSAVPSSDAEAIPFPYQKIKGLSQPRAMVVIARHFDGIIRSRDLTKILVASGLMKKTKNVSVMTSRLLRMSDRFERISEGLYRLKTGETNGQQQSLVETVQ